TGEVRKRGWRRIALPATPLELVVSTVDALLLSFTRSPSCGSLCETMAKLTREALTTLSLGSTPCVRVTVNCGDTLRVVASSEYSKLSRPLVACCRPGRSGT